MISWFKSKTSKILLSLLITFIFIYFLVIYNNIDFTTFYNFYNKISVGYLIIIGCLFLAANLIRSFRFKLMIDEKHVYFSNIFASNNVYNLATATLPGGIGEIVSMGLFSRWNSIGMSISFTIIILSRLFDLLILGICLLISVSLHADQLLISSRLLFVVALMAIIASLLALYVSMSRQIFTKIGVFLSKWKIGIKIQGMLNKIQRGFLCIKTAREWCLALILSFFVIFLSILFNQWILHSIHIRVSVIEMSIVFGIYALMQIIPIQGFAGIGTQEAWWTLALTSIGISREIAIPASFFLHGLSYAYILIVGLLFSVLIRKKR